eukprot:1296690-Rhodomonas_salina.1
MLLPARLKWARNPVQKLYWMFATQVLSYAFAMRCSVRALPTLLRVRYAMLRHVTSCYAVSGTDLRYDTLQYLVPNDPSRCATSSTDLPYLATRSLRAVRH